MLLIRSTSGLTSGNYSLSKVLPTIYAVNRDPINNHVMTLVSILPNCGKAEMLSLLSLFTLIAKDNPTLLEKSVPQLCENLSMQSTASSTLQVFLNIAQTRPQILTDHLSEFQTAAQNFPKSAMTAIQVMCAIAKVKEEKASEVMDFILANIGRLESEKHSTLLKEILTLTNMYPYLLTATLINRVSNLQDGASSVTRNHIQELRNNYNEGSRDVNTGVTIVKVGGGYDSKTDLVHVKPQQSGHIYQQQKHESKTASTGEVAK